MTRRRLLLLAVVIASLAYHRPITAQTPAGNLRIVLLVDSGTATARMTTPLRAGLLAFLDDLPGDAEVAFITTGGQLQVRVKPTADRDEVRKAVEAFASTGGANAFAVSLIESYKRFLKPATDKRPVFVIVTTEATAGNDNDVRVDDYNKFAQEFKQRDGRAHAIVIGGLARGVTSAVAENLCQNSGGRFERIADATAVTKILKDVAVRVSAGQ